ncbi:MAG: hypothetical protein IT531_12590 [Burkholderiales bacterium]|nr:hypothetical protein [Burkholderiales bacterium]
MMRNLAMLAVSVAALVLPQQSSAQSYPARAIRIIVPFPAAGVSDVAARVIGQKLTERWGQQTVVENRTGAGGTIGTELAARAEPDGGNNASSLVLLSPDTATSE